ncbi:hypothetical protein DF186_15630, partial [Enterococcus hirae]
ASDVTHGVVSPCGLREAVGVRGLPVRGGHDGGLDVAALLLGGACRLEDPLEVLGHDLHELADRPVPVVQQRLGDRGAGEVAMPGDRVTQPLL